MKGAKVALGVIGNASAQQAKERRRNVLKDMNNNIMPLAEEDDQLQGAAPLLFGEGFEKKMKDQVDAVCCLRKSGKPTESHFQQGRPHGTGYHRGRGSNRRRGGHRFHPYNNRSNGIETFRRSRSGHRAASEKNKTGTELAQRIALVYSYKCIPIVSLLPNIINCYPSEMVNHLMRMGIVPLARDHAERGIPLAGRLKHFLPNWRVVTQDQWVLEAVQGYEILGFKNTSFSLSIVLLYNN